MTTEVYINGNLIDLEDEQKITATYGNLSFGELNKRKGIKTNTWSIPFSQRNKLAFESCELSNSESIIPYRNNLISVDIDGVTVFEGFCTIEESNEGYDINSFAGASDFYSIITKTKLVDIDLSAYDHVWGEYNIKNSWNNAEGYIYSYVEYGKFELQIGLYPDRTVIPPDYLLPSIFFHTVIKAIAAYAGYTISGEVLSDERFLKHVILANKFPLPISYGGTFELSKLLPDVMQSKVWLDFANIYGQQFDVDDVEKEIRCTYIDDLIFNDPEDWTDKVDASENQKTKYKLDNYGRSSFLRFKSDSETDANGCYQDYAKEIAIDDDTLDPEKDVYKSDFYLIQNNTYPNESVPETKTYIAKKDTLYYGVWDDSIFYTFPPLSIKTYVWRNGTYYLALDTSIPTNTDPATNPTYWKPTLEKDIWDAKSRPMYGSAVIDISSPMVVAFDDPVSITRVIFATGLDWPTSYDRHYRVFGRVINKTKYIEKLIKLNYADINQMRFDTLKIVDNELYVLEEITQFKLNETDSTICKMIRL